MPKAGDVELSGVSGTVKQVGRVMGRQVAFRTFWAIDGGIYSVEVLLQIGAITCSKLGQCSSGASG